MAIGFLDHRDGRPWQPDDSDREFGFFQGQGPSALEIAVTDHGSRPTKKFLQRSYSDRRGGCVNPILIVAIYDDRVGLCGPSGEEPPIFRNLDKGQAERVCDAALDQPDRHTAQQFLSETLPQLEDELAGIRNQGLLSAHELRVGVPQRDDWSDANKSGKRTRNFM